MRPRDKSQWLRFQRRANQYSPEIRKALLDAYDAIADALTPEELERLIQGDTALLDRALAKVRDEIQNTVRKGFNVAAPDIPKVNGQIGVAFDVLSPKVIDAVRVLDSRVMRTLSDDIRETFRAYVENALRDGRNPRNMKEVRALVGMSPTQAENAAKYEAKLQVQGLSADSVERKVAAYRNRAIKLNAETNARTATIDSLKLGHKLSWQDAINKGIVDPALLMKRWVSVGDNRVRPEHQAMNGQAVPFDYAYSNGDDIPGESAFNCRCISVMYQRKPETP